jgi:hypothetical protein
MFLPTAKTLAIKWKKFYDKVSHSGQEKEHGGRI